MYTDEKIKRKRVLISSDFKSAKKSKQILDVFIELNQSRWLTEQVQCQKLKTFLGKTLTDLRNKYESVVFKEPPKKAKRKEDEDPI